MGLLDNLVGGETEGPLVDTTCSLYLPSRGKMVCGRANGTIVVVSN